MGVGVPARDHSLGVVRIDLIVLDIEAKLAAERFSNYLSDPERKMSQACRLPQAQQLSMRCVSAKDMQQETSIPLLPGGNGPFLALPIGGKYRRKDFPFALID